LNQLGAKIEGAGSSTIVITGVPGLTGGEYTVFADRLQAGTYLIAGAATNGDVTVTGVVPEHQAPVISKLKESGAHVSLGGDWVRVRGTRYLQAISVKTMPYPGFPTDIQQPMCALLTTAHGVSVVEETIYESRIGHIAELNRMGAKIRLEGRTSVITGVDHLHGTVVESTDLRAGAALAIAGLMAQGETIIKNVHHIDRGYENFDENLRSLGADVQRLETVEVEGVLR
ncbi:MAG: hypothetical protein QXI19_05560, partial [Candidatus Caldarchaeum sp.]